MGYPVKKEDKKYTYGDYINWPENERWELIDGIAYNMSPAPNRIHQEIVLELARQIANYLHDKTCKIYVAPFDIRLPVGDERDEDIITVVQPDIVVVCDHSKLDDKGCRGVPDLAIEVLSPFTVQKDVKIKFHLYERVGIKEFWIVHPTDKTIMVFRLEKNSEYGKPAFYSTEDTLKVGILEGLEIDLKEVFRE